MQLDKKKSAFEKRRKISNSSSHFWDLIDQKEKKSKRKKN